MIYFIQTIVQLSATLNRILIGSVNKHSIFVYRISLDAKALLLFS